MTSTSTATPPSSSLFGGPVAVWADGATKVYGTGDTTVRALDDVSVTLPAGRFTAVMGPSGSGKSTLLHCMAGLDSLTAGRIVLGDVDLSRLNDRQLTQLRRDRLGFVFQSFNLLPTLTAAENIVLPLRLAGRQPDQAWLDTVIGTVGLGDRLRHRPSELSGGQQQRVAVARALVSRPQVVFADEPTGNLDSRSGSEVLEFLRRAVDEMGQTIVMVTHDPVAAGYADAAVFLADGRIVDLMDQPSAERVLDRLKSLDPRPPTADAPRPGPTGTPTHHQAAAPRPAAYDRPGTTDTGPNTNAAGYDGTGAGPSTSAYGGPGRAATGAHGNPGGAGAVVREG